MRTHTAIIIVILCIIFGIFWGLEIWNALTQHWALLMRWFNNTRIHYYPWYLWLLLGGVIFPLMNKYFVKNMEMTKTVTHELTHVITGLLLFRRIHSIHAEEAGSGVVWSSGNEKLRFMSSLAPYCFPIYTFPLLMLRSIVMPSLFPIMDILIGFSMGLHIVCFKEQTGNHQEDITQFPLWFSYVYILSIWLFDISLVMLAYLPKLNIFYAFRIYALDMWHLLTS